MSDLTVSVSCRNIRGRIDPRTLRRRLTRVLRYLELDDAEVSCLLCDDSFIHELNRTYRGKDKPTDVLSFSMNEGEVLTGDRRLLGDIVISLDTAERQAAELGRTTQEELISLAVHGLLHLLGYDHISRRDEKVMLAKSTELERLFSVG